MTFPLNSCITAEVRVYLPWFIGKLLYASRKLQSGIGVPARTLDLLLR